MTRDIKNHTSILVDGQVVIESKIDQILLALDSCRAEDSPRVPPADFLDDSFNAGDCRHTRSRLSQISMDEDEDHLS